MIETHPHNVIHVSRFAYHSSGLFYDFCLQLKPLINKDYREVSFTIKSTKNIYDHSNITGHTTTLYNFSIVAREEQNLSRLIKESIYIRVNCIEISLPYLYILDNFKSDFNFDFNSNSKCSHI